MVWKHLLGVYPNGMPGGERIKHVQKKVTEYEGLKQAWLDMVLQGQVRCNSLTVRNKRLTL